jgi:hypothetical protein
VRSPAGVWVDTGTAPTVQKAYTIEYIRLFAELIRGASDPLLCARVAELADARDLGSRGQPWGFKSPLSHQAVAPQLIGLGCVVKKGVRLS